MAQPPHPTREQRSTQQLILWIGCATASYVVFAALFIKLVPSDPELAPIYRQVPSAAYLVPAVAFSTAFLLNALKLAVDWGSVQAQFSMLACYIAVIAALTDYLHLAGLPPVIKDSFGQGLHVLRLALWLWTTPAMVWLLGYISDLSKQEVFMYMLADAGMILACLLGLVQPHPVAGAVGILLSCAFFALTMHGVWKMFQAPLSTLSTGTTQTSLVVLRNFTAVTWTAFVVVFFIFKAGIFSPMVEEWTWGFMDIIGKVMFSSGLLQSNFINIEERRRQAMKLVEEGRQKQVLEELTSLVRQKEQFMSSMSHELRTPLNGIIGLSDALLIGCCGDLTDMSRKTISTIKSSGLRLLNLINDILDSSTMKHGKLNIRNERVKLDRLVDDVLDLLKPLAKKGVTLVNDISSSMAPVAGDTGRIMQIFHHIIGNACKFTYNGSITVSAILKMDEVEVAVADTGIGIPREKFRTIFQPFEQVDVLSRREHTGTGFGLTLVKQLVEAHGGFVSLKSKVGVGTTIYITLKVWDPSAHAATMEKVMSPQDIEVTKDRVSKMMSILKLRVGDARRIDLNQPHNNTPTAAAAAGTTGHAATPAAADAAAAPAGIDATTAAEQQQVGDAGGAGARPQGPHGVPRRVRSTGLVLTRSVPNMESPYRQVQLAADPLTLQAPPVVAGLAPLPPIATTAAAGARDAPAAAPAAAALHPRHSASKSSDANNSDQPIQRLQRQGSHRPLEEEDNAPAAAADAQHYYGQEEGGLGGFRDGLRDGAVVDLEGEEGTLPAPGTRRSSTEQPPARPSQEVPRTPPAGAGTSAGALRAVAAPGSPEVKVADRRSGGTPPVSAMRAAAARAALGAESGPARSVGFALRPSVEEGNEGEEEDQEAGVARRGGRGGDGVEQEEAVEEEDVQGGEVGEAAQAGAAAVAGQAPMQGIHVLSVDDDNVNQMVVETWLTSEGMTVTRAMDGEEALEALRSMDRLPDIILLDVMMPGMSGYEVCRTLRELYPTACVPVIMLSAKGKEEDVVEGLTVGANDYVVKPFSRKELLARIQAHLRYRASAMQAAVTTDTSPESDRPSHVSEGFMETLCTASQAFSLPPSIKSKVENSTGVSAPLQVFDDLTMLVVGVTNLDALTASRNPSLPELLGSLTSLYICLEDLLVQHNAYLVDCLEDRLIIVTGLSGTTVQEQVCNALDLAEELNKLVITLMPTANGSSRLLLSAGIHCCTAMAAIVGLKHPVLQVTGALSEKAMQLQGTCPPGCIHVSRRVVEASNRSDQFVPSAALPSSPEATYLHRSGPWSAHQNSMAQRFERYMASHPFGPIDSGAMRLRPVQRALLSLLQADIGWLVEIISSGERNRRLGQSQASQALSTASAPDDSKAHSASAGNRPVRAAANMEGLKLVTKLQLDKEELLRELDHRTAEADRLQVVVDNLQLDLYGLEALQSQLDASATELNKLRGELAAIEALRGEQPSAAGPADADAPAPAGATGTAQGVAVGVPLLREPVAMRTYELPLPRAAAAANMTAIHALHRADTGSSSNLQGGVTEDLLRRDRAPPPSISEFLASLGMAQLSPVFEREEITPDMLPYIHDATLLQLGVTSVGDLVRLRRAAQTLS